MDHVLLAQRCIISEIEILILEDDEDIREMYADSLEELGMPIHECDSIDSARDLFLKNENIKIGLFDYFTPGSDQAFKSADTPIMSDFNARTNFFFYFVTGSIELTEAEAQSVGAKGILRKPFLIDQLQKLVVEAASELKSL